ncbi:MAG: hypothetical protein A2284_06180 [Deltaproteobacteria bacterium RIFOXYA12_FULL_61_11]|nr:MAG: hypothetical protein A2284_06180 [Deltaproteobacteria bacterium RIFOXYA12_FULL_61_11]
MTPGRSADRLYRLLFEQVPCSLAVIDPELDIIETNDRFTAIFGPARSAKCYQLQKGRNSPCPDCLALSAFQDGHVHVTEQQGIDRHGHPTYYIVYFAPVLDAAGKVRHVLEMATDVTEIKRLQREYQLLFEQAPCFLSVINRDYRIVRANERLRSTFPFQDGATCYSTFKQCSERCSECPVALTFEDGQPHTQTHVGTSSDGSPVHYLVTSMPLDRGEEQPNHVLEMALDLTETIALERELAHASLLHRKLVESSMDGILLTDAAGTVIDLNPALAELLGPRQRPLRGHRLPLTLFERTVQRRLAANPTASLELETKLKPRGSTPIPVRLVVTPLLDEREGMLGRAFLVQDLSALKRMEAEKLEAERLAVVGQTVAGLAHGIKNIITGLEGGLYVCASGRKRGNEQKANEGWAMIERNVERISTLTKNLLAFSKGEQLSFAPHAPAALLEDVASLFRSAAATENITLTVASPVKVEPFPFCYEALHESLVNLVSNALDACRMSSRDRNEITLGLEDRRDSVILSVQDDGIGMDCDVKQRVFTSFFTTKGKHGTGLGLLTTRKVLFEHGGTVEFDSTPGQGSIFKLVLPKHRPG